MKLFTKTMNILLLSLVATGASCYTFKIFHKNNAQAPTKQDLLETTLSSLDSEPTIPVVPVAIIGSGPAGLSAAMYTARAKLNTVVFAGHELGGELSQVKAIENLPGKPRMTGAEAMKDLYDQAQHFGAVILDEAIKSVDFSSWPFTLTAENNHVFKALSVIIATGGVAKKLNIPGINDYWGHGVGLCTLCDAPFNKDQDVLVVGGGDTAAERALQLAAYARKVTMIVKEDTVSACKTMQDYLKKHENVTILTNTEVVAIKGNGDTVTHVVCSDLSKPNTQYELPAYAVYFSVGYKPSSQMFQEWLATDEEGYILLQGRSQKTSLPGVFAAGIVEDKEYAKAAVAEGNGVKAGIDAIRFLESKGLNAAAMQALENRFFNTDTKTHEEMPEEIPGVESQEELEKYIHSSSQPVVVEFFSPQCPRCMHLAPAVKTLQAQTKDTLTFVKVDITKAPQLAQNFSIRGLPVFMVFEKGQETHRCKKITTREELRLCLTPWLS